ncbi:hypothetical protein FQA47_012068 [Oryzias melastigma]|uniref:Uncharacterized protein n=1 Tax=Oryzias melastigma TaxID=30732 RepID=A0A834CNZ8_ORYME|nr:hypothetical protein FQA47_012068 [Oryzias melastigma]
MKAVGERRRGSCMSRFDKLPQCQNNVLIDVFECSSKSWFCSSGVQKTFQSPSTMFRRWLLALMARFGLVGVCFSCCLLLLYLLAL